MRKFLYIIDQIEWGIVLFFAITSIFSAQIMISLKLESHLTDIQLGLFKPLCGLTIVSAFLIKKFSLSSFFRSFFKRETTLFSICLLIISHVYYGSIIGIFSFGTLLSWGYKSLLYILICSTISLGLLFYFKPVKSIDLD